MRGRSAPSGHSDQPATLAAVDERAPAAIGRLTGLAYTLKNAELRSRVVEITKSSYELGAEWLRALAPVSCQCRGASRARDSCLIEGLVMQRILTPELCPEEVFYAAFAALADSEEREVCDPIHVALGRDIVLSR